ncbi:FimV/HubP family polar landmark protein [Ideonella sp.]|uniref:FimV/HubP family polar landmark protein n=1 Tax=Ideonella sp. TaxID=1929293 RepID=UPI0037BE27EC
MALLLVHTGASALSLGRLSVQSSLGEPLRAEVDITSISPDEAASLRATLASPDAFKAAGVDFNAALVGAKVALGKRADGRSVIRIRGDRSMSEPFVDMVLDFAWNGGRLQRSYTLLIDPPSRVNEAPSPVLTSPALSAAPVAATPLPPVASSPSRVPAPAALAPEPVDPPAPKAPAKAKAKPEPKPTPVPKEVDAAAPASVTADSYKVKQGDTLSAIAARHAQSGVSLDQMLVSLYRGNPQAFMGSNMNRLKSGVVLNVPDAAAANEVSQPEARKVIQAHSADFAAFRQQLAQSVPSVPVKESPRQAKGKVEAAVEDRKVTAAPATPDKLTLSRGNVAASAAEAQLSKEAERKAAAARMAELARNVDELKKLSEKPATPVASNTAKPPATPPVAAPTAPVLPPVATVTPGMTVPSSKPTAPVMPPVAAPATVPTPPKPAVGASAPASAPVASKPEPAASAPAVAASAASVPSAPVPPVPVVASAPAMPASAAASSAVAAAPAAPSGLSEPTFLESLTNNDYVLPGAVGVVALLAGLGLMRLRRRSQEGSETSFLESKLQPDSFFGVSGGQRVDTRDGANSAASSSLSYSLSQLDAIGDVDPVAEADVYLAYGRDLQAEEILKEALRTDPNRSAIRLKLLEVYAKRADVAGFESQALLLRDAIGESGDDWPKAQEMGRSIDPGNPLYGHEGSGAVDLDTSMRAPADLRDPAPTQPATDFMPVEEPAARLSDDMDIDLDIDLDTPPENTGLEATRPADPDMMLGLDTSASKPAPAPVVDTKPGDLPDLDLTLDLPDAPASVSPAPDSGFDFGDISLDLDPVKDDAAATPSQLPDAPQAPEVSDSEDADDPLARKLELADEFRRIGDIEGARDLLDEVIAQASGPMKARAQTMLGELG